MLNAAEIRQDDKEKIPADEVVSLRRWQENAVRQLASHGREKVKEVWKINLKMPLRQEIDREGKLILVTFVFLIEYE